MPCLSYVQTSLPPWISFLQWGRCGKYSLCYYNAEVHTAIVLVSLVGLRCFRRPFKSLFRRTKEASGGPLVKAREKLRVVAPLWPWTATWTKKQNHCRRQVYFLSFLDQGSPLCSFVFITADEKKPSDIFMMIKSTVRWTSHVAHMEATKNTYTSLVEYQCVDRRMMGIYIYIYTHSYIYIYIYIYIYKAIPVTCSGGL
jgi:hypothetical protein